jgi:hypothetical protein
VKCHVTKSCRVLIHVLLAEDNGCQSQRIFAAIFSKQWRSITWLVLVGFGAGSWKFATVQKQHPLKCYMRFYTLFDGNELPRNVLMI